MRHGGYTVCNGNQGRTLCTRAGNDSSFPGDLDLIASLVFILIRRPTSLLTFRPTNGPVQSKIRPKYLAPRFKVEIISTDPTRVTRIGMTICQQCSSIRPDDQETTKVTMYAMTYGGAWTKYVTVSEKLRVATICFAELDSLYVMRQDK